MSRRSLATVLVGSLLVVLVALAVVLPVPYVTMSPGPTFNVLGESGNRPIITVRGHRTYPVRGDLRMTTVSVTNPTARVGLADVLAAWFDRSRAVYPRDVIYPPDQSAQDVEQQSTVEMVSSQDTAVAAALRLLGYDPPLRTEVFGVAQDSPAEGRLRTRDQILRVDGVRIRDAEQVGTLVQRVGAGGTATFAVRRDGATRTVRVRPEAGPKDADGKRRALVGIRVGVGYDFPFDVSVRLSDDVGGPSAGLIFSLGVYDTLTPGSLTGGTDVAGTGTIDDRGRVGPIGGIQQKIVAAHDAGAKVFLVPPADCGSAVHADVTKEDIRLVKAPTLRSAVASLKTYRSDPSADLPSCG